MGLRASTVEASMTMDVAPGAVSLSRPVTTLDWAVLGDLLGREKVREVFDSSAFVQGWLDVGQTLARADAARAGVPAGVVS
jgi:hypothetical protein